MSVALPSDFDDKKEKFMEQIVKSYIYSKPCGVKLTDLEGFLKQSRLRLGYITRKLQNEGEIIKKDDKYYPVKFPDASKI